MFDFFRNNIKFMMGVLIVLIIPAFVFVGVDGYSGFRERSDVVATVGPVEITRPQWDAAHRDQMDRLASSLPGVDRSLFDNESSRFETLDNLITQQVLALAAQEGLLMTTDSRLARELSQDPTIAELRRPDGSLDVERYTQLLRAQGLSPEMFESSVRGDLVRSQVLRSVSDSAFTGAQLARQTLDPFFEQRDVQVAWFKPEQYLRSVVLTDEQVQAFYDQNPGRFQTIEALDVQYVVLSAEALSSRVQVSEEDLRGYFEQNQANQAFLEERQARHILLTVDAEAPTEVYTARRQEAEALLAQLRQSPDLFAALAGEHSDDPGSAAAGGDLGFFGRGSMVKAFEDVAFSLDTHALSEVVETEFGFHLIQVTAVRTPEMPSFEVMRPELEAQLRQQQTQRLLAEAAEEFSNLVYEQPDSLEPAARAFGLTLQSATEVRRQGPADAAQDAVLNHQRLLAALYSDDAIRLSRNTEVVEVAPGELVGARVVAHRPARVRAFDEVQTLARDQLAQRVSVEQAATQGKAQLAQWQAGTRAPQLEREMRVSRTSEQSLPVMALNAALSAQAGASTAAWTSVDLGNDGWMAIRVNRVVPRETPESERASLERAQLAEVLGQAEAQAYLAHLRERFKVEIRASRRAVAS